MEIPTPTPTTAKAAADIATKGSSDDTINNGAKRQIRKAKNKNKKMKLNDAGESIGGFTRIGGLSYSEKQVVKRVLPKWLANPSVISCNLKEDSTSVYSLGLSSQLTSILEENFISYFFPVQKQIIPWLLNAHSPKLFRPPDLCVSAPTGSGKTLAYVLPIINILLTQSLGSKVQALVILPTEILAFQIYSVFLKYCMGTNLKVFLMSKRVSLNSERLALVKRGRNGKSAVSFNIIVATPGRLLDHIECTEEFDLSNLKFLVVDEADRTLDEQQGHWLHRLEMKFWSYHAAEIQRPWESMPLNLKFVNLHLKSFQKLLFSATLSPNPEILQNLHLFQPKLFTSLLESQDTIPSKPEVGSAVITNQVSDVGKYAIPSELKESFVLCRKETKPLILAFLINKFNMKRVLCFVNTKENTHRLCLLLKFMGNVNVREISSTWTPQTRDLVIKKFIEGHVEILVTSDQISRGIDIPLVQYVISYDLPSQINTYIHRIGRTARAGEAGNSVALIEKSQIGSFKKIIKRSGKSNVEKITIKNSELKPMEDKFKTALSQLKEHLG